LPAIEEAAIAFGEFGHGGRVGVLVWVEFLPESGSMKKRIAIFG